MKEASKLTQSEQSIEKNISFFQKNLDTYNQNVQTLDSYAYIRNAVNEAINGIDSLLDIGNGGVFDYDTKLVKNICALDLFLDKLPDNFVCPSNVSLKTGSALDIPEKDKSYDGVLMVMLIHHLVGTTVKESIYNMQTAIKEAYRVLKPGGKFVLAESCVPQWFYVFEKIVYPLASRVINMCLEHPATLQYTSNFLAQTIERNFGNVSVKNIPMGRWVIQFGYKFPTFLTPVQEKIFIAYKE